MADCPDCRAGRHHDRPHCAACGAVFVRRGLFLWHPENTGCEYDGRVAGA